jgi:outer membrane protein/protease secretion system outer membrane protein
MMRINGLVLAGLLALGGAASPIGLVWAQTTTPPAVMGPWMALERARTHNAELQAARQDLKSALEELNKAQAQLRPSVGLSYVQSEVRRRDNQSTKVTEYGSTNRNLSVRQPLYRKSLAVAIERAEQRKAAIESNLRFQEQALSFKLLAAYADVLLAQAQETSAQAQLTWRQAQHEAALQSRDKGLGTLLQVNDTRIQRDLAELEVRTARLQIRVAQEALKTHVGELPQDLLQLDLPALTSQPLTLPELEVQIDRALQDSPILRAMMSQVEVARQDLEQARSGHLPTVDAFFQNTKSEGETASNPLFAFRSNTLGVQVNIPIYSGGGIESGVRQAVAELEKAEFSQGANRRAVIEQISRDNKQFLENAQKVQVLTQAWKDAQLNEQAARMALTAGLGTRLQLLEAQAAVQRYRRDLTEAYKLKLVAFLSIQAISGPVSDDDLQTWLNLFRLAPQRSVAQAPR